MGINSPEDHYYRRLITDGVRAVDAARAMAQVDPSRIAVAGGSQGGGIALAVAALDAGISAALIDLPFLSDIRRAVETVDTDPYAQIGRYLRIYPERVEQVFDTLAYFDGSILGSSATAPGLFSVGLMDDICPPSAVYSGINAYGGARRCVSTPTTGTTFPHRITVWCNYNSPGTTCASRKKSSGVVTTAAAQPGVTTC